jgi:ubiquinone biosynthesis protein Coq4
MALGLLIGQAMKHREAFEQAVVRKEFKGLAHAVKESREGNAEARASVVAAVCWAAFACPAAITPIYDQLAAAWLGVATLPLNTDLDNDFEFPDAPLAPAFWQTFWSVIDEKNFDAASITQAVAGLGGGVDPSMQALSENAAREHPGAQAALHRPVPGHTRLEVLEALPEGSLGAVLYRMLIDNGYDLEVLDRDAIQLANLPTALQYLNVRILQMHDIWHLAAGYSTSGSDEIAISAFQLAQFGHNYSAMFLAVVLMKSHVGLPQAFPLLLQLILEAWVHGRQTPALMEIEWEQEWHQTIDQVRSRFGIRPFQSVLPTDMLEVFGSGTRWSRLKTGWQLSRLLKRLKAGEQLYSS